LQNTEQSTVVFNRTEPFSRAWNGLYWLYINYQLDAL